MQTPTNGPERPTGAISARPATTTRKNKKRTSEALSPAQRLLRQQRQRRAAVAELRRIRAEAEAEVERLLALLDQLDGYPDDEPSLGFLECFTGSGRSGNAGGCAADREEDSSYVTEAARQRYKPFDRHVSNNDGRHVDVARGYGAYSHIRNLSDRQREKVAPRIDLDSTVRAGQ